MDKPRTGRMNMVYTESKANPEAAARLADPDFVPEGWKEYPQTDAPFRCWVATNVPEPSDAKVQFVEPLVFTGERDDFTPVTRETTLTVDAALNRAPADIALVATGQHDGTHEEVYRLISGITQAAEQHVASQPGKWRASQVCLLQRFVYADGVIRAHGDPPRSGVAPIYEEDAVGIRLRRDSE